MWTIIYDELTLHDSELVGVTLDFYMRRYKPGLLGRIASIERSLRRDGHVQLTEELNQDERNLVENPNTDFPTLSRFVACLWDEAEGTEGRKATRFEGVEYCRFLRKLLDGDQFRNFHKGTELRRQRKQLLVRIDAILHIDGTQFVEQKAEEVLVDASGHWNRESRKWQEINKSVEFWVNEVLRMAERRPAIEKMRSFTPAQHNADMLYRYIWEEEK